MTPSDSRRASIMSPTADDSRVAILQATQGLRKASGDEELREERSKAVSRAAYVHVHPTHFSRYSSGLPALTARSGLKKSLMDLSAFSTETNRRLDDTYFALLEKLSILQNTINTIKDVAIMSHTTSDTLQTESQELVEDIQGQLDAMGNFDEHEKRIRALQARIETGQAKIGSLSDRVDVVKKRIEMWEQADREWQERTRRRLKVVWIIISVVFFAILALLLSVQYMEPVLESAGVDMTNRSLPIVGKGGSERTRPNGSIPRGLTERDECPSDGKVQVPLILKDRPRDEDRLRLLDEL